MMHNQASPACRGYFTALRGDHLLARYPVALPAILLAGALGVYAASFFANDLFSALAFFRIYAAPVCLALAFVLGVAGTLAIILSILEHIDRCHLRSAAFPKQKGA